jgi:hypothetical protein
VRVSCLAPPIYRIRRRGDASPRVLIDGVACLHRGRTRCGNSRTRDRVRVLFYALNSPVTPLIRIVTGDHHTHVAIALEGRLFEALYNGVRRLEGSAAVERAGEADAFVDLPIRPSCREHLRHWLDGQVGRQYDFGQMLSMWLASFTHLRVVFGHAGAWTCSGLVATVLEFAGVLITPEPRLETPGSLYRMLVQLARPASGVTRLGYRPPYAS